MPLRSGATAANYPEASLNRTLELLILLPLTITLYGPSATRAAEVEKNLVVPPKIAEDNERNPGFHPMLKGSANLALGHSKNVAGTTDGTTINFGYLVNSALDFLNTTREHEWQNTLTLQLGYSRTPIIAKLLKSADTIDFKTSYLYHIPQITWIGPFASLAFITAMLPGDTVSATDTKIMKLGADEKQLFDDAGNIVDENGDLINIGSDRIEFKKAGRRIRLTPPFAPLSLRESAGVFAIPVDKKVVKLDLRIGVGAWETFVRGGYTIDDNAKTSTTLELRQMKDSVLLGPEFLAVVSGILRENIVYKFRALLMYPAYRSVKTDLEGAEVINVELEALVQVKLWEWLSLDYTFKAFRLPFIVDAWQIQNSLNITASIAVI